MRVLFVIFCVCYEIRAAIRKMKLGKSTGPSSKSVELLEAPEDYRIDSITAFLNKIYDSGQIPPHIPKFIFMAAECKLHIMNSFMSHITTILLRMMMM